MLSVDAAFDRISSALQERGYKFAGEQKSSDSSGDRSAVFTSPALSVRVNWSEKARLLALQIDSNGTWIDFARHGFGPRGLEDSTVDALVRKVVNEVGETSTDSD
jgi:hypothetical protein